MSLPGRSVRRRRIFSRNTRPAVLGGDVFRHVIGDERNGRCFVGMFVEDRAIEPDDMRLVLFDLGRFFVMRLSRMRAEVAVCDRVIVVVPGARLVHVLWGKRGSEQQVRAGYEQRCQTGHRANHALHY